MTTYQTCPLRVVAVAASTMPLEHIYPMGTVHADRAAAMAFLNANGWAYVDAATATSFDPDHFSHCWDADYAVARVMPLATTWDGCDRNG